MLKKINANCLWLICVFMVCTHTQNLDWLKVQEAKFKFKRYTWGDEFSFLIRGNSHQYLKNAKLILEIRYQGKLASQYNFQLTTDSSATYFPFRLLCGPLNEPYQRVLAGKYKVTIYIIIAGQSLKVRKKLSSFKGAKYDLFNESIYWKTEKEFIKEDREIKNFYQKRLQRLDTLYKELLKNAQLALEVQKSIQYRKPNPFIGKKQQKFSPILWRKWLQKKLQEPTKNELAMLRKFYKKTYCRRYPEPNSNLEEFAFVLLRYARILSIRIHEYHKVKVDVRDASRVDPFGVSREQGLINHLSKLLRNTAKSLENTK
ncbi:hypothetical protein [Candidatus Uabimicrobium amorphum]|uniref:Uncharacterized protein n=1 Tax=Uabimicrobium amorphum TaxID=2596890 RepID=A0A5S9IUA5_UABAM|nr:hypothetical protein [Candidatus Uabimicrobium amorphum]BBM88064.1 hypothetical protein UABAM_06480 [Candidatus Uabimicrobium amorphum]